MGNFLESVQQREVAELRKKVINLFSYQQLLLVGHLGVGKSSFVNTVNYVINLVKPRSVHAEIAEVFNQEDRGSCAYMSYGSDRGMYGALRESKFSAEQMRGPIFYDLPGFKYSIDFDLTQMLIYLVNGQVREDTYMVKMFNNKEKIEQWITPRREDNQRPQIVLCMVSVADTFPQQLLEHVSEAQIKLQSYGESKIV